jgi:thymidylate kinase
MNRLVVFEGPDQVGKSTIIKSLEKKFEKRKINYASLSFPGNEEGTLGSLVYNIHHDYKKYEINSLSPSSLQTLHVASHIDIIERKIKPLIKKNTIILLDRYWWSTIAYGKLTGLTDDFLDKLIDLEKTVWENISPAIVFLIKKSFSSEKNASNNEVWEYYLSIVKKFSDKNRIEIIKNENLTETVKLIDNKIMDTFFYKSSLRNNVSNSTKKKRDEVWAPAKPTEVLDTYWYFATERQNIFFKRIHNETFPWSNDMIFQSFKFTNAYRASDRVSQYLIKNVIYKGESSIEEIFFRIILFKLFNKIETWEILNAKLGSVNSSEYSFDKYNKILNESMIKGLRIYSAAYMMSSGSTYFGFERKHSNHLKLIELMMKDELPKKIKDAKSMLKVFELLRAYPTIGDFLAYQLAIDINYSPLTEFSEMSFVVPGPGALDGIWKCFSDLGGLNEVEIIKLMTERQNSEFERLGLNFKNLWGRDLQLIDCQNLFCEVDKYSRIAHPDIIGLSGRTRIKQKYVFNTNPIEYWYPPKWGINNLIVKEDVKNGYLFQI